MRFTNFRPSKSLPSLLAAMPELCGLNVTIPYKRSVMHLLDRIAPEVQAIGAVNCIRRLRDGSLEGHNTDIAGLRAALDRLLGGAEPAQALVLGTGAPRRPCNTHWPNAGFLSHWYRATRRKATTLYDNLPCEAVAESRLIVNASPVGTYPAVGEAPRIPYAYITPEHFLLDLVYNPPLTRFLDCGLRRGARVLNGETMFRGQAEASWRIWNT